MGAFRGLPSRLHCPGSLQAGYDTFPNAVTFKLRDRSEDVQLQATGWRTCVDSRIQGHERDAHGGEFIEQEDQMTETPSEAVQPPTHEHIQPPPLGVNG
jgi:hypothetical protein